MFKLVMMLGKVMPEELVLEKLSESINDYALDNSEDNRKSLHLNIMLAMAKFDGMSIEEFDKGIDKVEAAANIMKFDES
jgi:hypothetical protein